MNKLQSTKQVAPSFLNWVKTECLPFWGSAGVDWNRGGFHERLDFEGRPVSNVSKRLMVQGRQLYVYCHADLLGWYGFGRCLAERCMEYMIASYFERDGRPGWVFSVSPDGNVASSARDTYAHAFALLGLAWYLRFKPDSQIWEIVNKTIAFMDESLTSGNGGYYDSIPQIGTIRHQNPHMHLFEALLALHESSGELEYLERAKRLFELFKASFFSPERGYLCEYLTDALTPAAGDRGQMCEPGHHYEWIWLLRKFEALSGEDTGYYCRSLYDHADQFGWDKDGFIVDELHSIGHVVKESRRSWPHTEGLKANLLEASLGRNGADARAAQCIRRLMENYLGRPIVGGWIDHLDQRGRPIVDFMPASTLYHIVCAAAETDRMVASRQGW